MLINFGRGKIYGKVIIASGLSFLSLPAIVTLCGSGSGIFVGKGDLISRFYDMQNCMHVGHL